MKFLGLENPARWMLGMSNTSQGGGRDGKLFLGYGIYFETSVES